MKNQPQIKGRFHAISSFAISSRKEFYIIGLLLEGDVQAHWCANIPLNSAMNMALPIKQVDSVEMAGDKAEYLLLIVEDDEGWLISFNIGSEFIDITTEDKS